MPLVLTRSSSERVLGFENKELTVILTFAQITDHSVLVTVFNHDGTEVLKQTVEPLETLAIGYVSTVTFYGEARPRRGQKRGKFSFNGPLRFWREEKCPDHRYPEWAK